MTTSCDPFARRRAGILLHPTSLPGPWGNGDLGAAAFHFVDFLVSSGQTLWQMLPLGPTHSHGSPYQCLSVHAGNPQLISIDGLLERQWLNEDDVAGLRAIKVQEDADEDRCRLLVKAYEGFCRQSTEEDRQALQHFIASEQSWLGDYALYQALRNEFHGRDWSQWPVPLRDRDPVALQQARARLQVAIDQVCFEQYLFFSQWAALKQYANERGVLMFGDLPIFVAYDSVDVWAQQHFFELDQQGQPVVVAGVPPDYFSASGQRWGNPHYRWQAMVADGFSWWLSRVAMQLQLFDIIRIDHFRGFQAYWEIPAGEETAINGRWVEAPGDEFFNALLERYGRLPFVAEDLGIITPEVTALREKYHLPGMKILQFAFDGNHDNPYLPYNHEHNTVVYTGTHDNDTTLGWYQALPAAARHYVDDYLGMPDEVMPWPLVRLALSSVAMTAVIPFQDVLGLGSEDRMNVPGTTAHNWQWRFSWEQVPEDAAARLRHLSALYGRIASD